MGVNSLISQRMPTLENVLTTAAYANPVTAPFAAAKGVYDSINSLMGENYRNNEMYGLTGNANTWGAPTIGSILGFSGTNNIKNDDGTGLSVNPDYGLGFRQVGLYGNVNGEDIGILGTGLTPRDERAFTPMLWRNLG